MTVPRVVDGIGGAVVGMAGGSYCSLVTTAEGRVLAFGGKGPEDAHAECGGLGLGAGVQEALTPTAIDGITVGDRAGRVEELGRMIDEYEEKKAEVVARHAEVAAQQAEELRRMEEEHNEHKVAKAALEKEAADEAMEGKEGKE